MTINQQIERLLERCKDQANALEFGNIDFIVQNGVIVRVDIRSSIKPVNKSR